MAKKSGFDIYQTITERIIAELEQGKIPWQKPWINVSEGAAVAVKHHNGEPYSLLNQMLLGCPGEYLTFNQCQKEGGKIKKGAKSKFVVFWRMIHKPVLDDEGNPVLLKSGKPRVDTIPLLRYDNVFHIDDCEGIKPRYAVPTMPETPVTVGEVSEAAEAIIAGYVERSGVQLRHVAQNRAFYRPSEDLVVLPEVSQFVARSQYYATAMHELTHSTGHPTRLNRLDSKAGFGSEVYSKEELVAEIGSAALMNVAGVENEDTFRNSAAYIQSWLQALRDDKRMIVTASSKAEKAVNLILGKEIKTNEEQEES